MNRITLQCIVKPVSYWNRLKAE